MERRPGSIAARLRLAAALAALALAGCANTSWQFSSGGAPQPVPPSGGFSVGTTSTNWFATLLTFGLINYAMFGGTPFYAAPPMDPERRVAEQDCSKPIEDPSANLRCR
jgi:hypothetical protein